MMYTFSFASQVELGLDISIKFIELQFIPSWKGVENSRFSNCSYTNMKAPFSLLALFTRREGNPGAVER